MRLLRHDDVKSGVVGVHHHLLGQKIHRGIVYAVDVADGRLHLGGAGRTVQVTERKTLFHDRDIRWRRTAMRNTKTKRIPWAARFEGWNGPFYGKNPD